MSRSVDTDASRSELPTVQHQVVGLRAHGQRVGRQQRQVLGVRHGEGMVRRLRHAVGAGLEHREVDDPDVAVRAFAHRGRAERGAQRAEHLAGGLVPVRDGEDEVARLGARRREDAHRLLVGEVARQRAIERHRAVGDPEPGEPGRPGPLRLLGQLVEARARKVRTRLDAQGLDGRRREGPHLGLRKHVGQVDELHAEAQVGLVGAEAVAGRRPTSRARSVAGARRWPPRPHRGRPRTRNPSRRPARRRSTPCRAA